MVAQVERLAARARSIVRVLVVDDSAFMRYVISKELSADPAIEVAGAARDGMDALEKIAQLRPDVVTLDLEMPRMDGLTALETIMDEIPVPVILLSSLSQEGASVTIRGLELGAVDFVPKPPPIHASSSRSTWEQLLAKVKGAAGLDVRRLRARVRGASRRVARQTLPARGDRRVGKLVVLGSSTGGPRALFDVVPRLPADLPAALLVVQHMPAGFTRSLAARLNEVARLEVREAVDGDEIKGGLALVAPGDYHMAVRRGGMVSLDKSPPIHGVRPAVDVTMESAASVYGAATIGVVLTGMGSDGTRGALSIKRAGGTVIAEDESTCVVYGMPRCVREAGAADRIVRLNRVADAIVQLIGAAE
mgnify:CR=1 FL=1